MRGTRLGVLTALAAVIVAAIAAAVAGSATITRNVDVGTKHASDAVERQTLPIEAITASTDRRSRRSRGRPLARAVSRDFTRWPYAADPPIGTVRLMPVLDDVFGLYRFRQFTLRGQSASTSRSGCRGPARPPPAGTTAGFPRG